MAKITKISTTWVCSFCQRVWKTQDEKLPLGWSAITVAIQTHIRPTDETESKTMQALNSLLETFPRQENAHLHLCNDCHEALASPPPAVLAELIKKIIVFGVMDEIRGHTEEGSEADG